MNVQDYSTKELEDELDRRANFSPRPKPHDPSPNEVSKIIAQCENCLDDEGEGDINTEHCLYEVVMEAVYGEDVWDWINSEK